MEPNLKSLKIVVSLQLDKKRELVVRAKVQQRSFSTVIHRALDAELAKPIQE